MFSKHLCAEDSNEAEVMPILEALQIFLTTFQDNLIVERDSSNVILWMDELE